MYEWVNERTNERFVHSIPLYNHQPYFLVRIFRSSSAYIRSLFLSHTIGVFAIAAPDDDDDAAVYVYSSSRFRIFLYAFPSSVNRKWLSSCKIWHKERKFHLLKRTQGGRVVKAKIGANEKPMECLKLWVQNVKSRIQVKWCRSQKSVSTSMPNIAVSFFYYITDTLTHCRIVYRV